MTKKERIIKDYDHARIIKDYDHARIIKDYDQERISKDYDHASNPKQPFGHIDGYTTTLLSLLKDLHNSIPCMVCIPRPSEPSHLAQPL